MKILWCFPLHNPIQGNQQSNIIAHSTRKQWSQHIKPMAPRHPRSYNPTYQEDLAIFYNQILYYKKNRTLLNAINYGSFVTWPGLTEKLISKDIPESEITPKGHLYLHNQWPVSSDTENITYIATKAGENRNEILLHLFDSTETIFCPYWEISSTIRDREQLHNGGLPL